MADEDSPLDDVRRSVIAALERELIEIRVACQEHNPGAFGVVARLTDPKTLDLVRAVIRRSREDRVEIDRLANTLNAIAERGVAECLRCDDIRRTGDASGKCHKHADGSWSCGGVHNGPGWGGPVPVPFPIPMQLWCPLCHTRHIDEGEFATKPHVAHACQNPTCCLVWTPAQVPTVGVYDLPGYLNSKL